MTAESVLADLLAHGIEPSVTPDGLGIAVPAGRLTAAQRSAVIAHKPELIARLIESSRITVELLRAAMRRCDEFNDNEVGRQAMREQCLELPPHLQADLLNHFNGKPSEHLKLQERSSDENET
jgi:hypothetical protein